MKGKQYSRMGEILKNNPYNYNNEIEYNFCKRARQSFEEKLKEYLIDNLRNFGYKFNSEDHFLSFVRERMTRIAFLDEPDKYLFFIDYVDENNRGVLVGSYCDKVTIEQNENSIIAIFNKDFE